MRSKCTKFALVQFDQFSFYCNFSLFSFPEYGYLLNMLLFSVAGGKREHLVLFDFQENNRLFRKMFISSVG